MKKTLYFQLVFILPMIGTTLNGFAQEKNKTEYIKNLNNSRSHVFIDSIKASLIAQVERNYTLDLKAILLNTTLSDSEKKNMASILIKERQKKIRAVLLDDKKKVTNPKLKEISQ